MLVFSKYWVKLTKSPLILKHKMSWLLFLSVSLMIILFLSRALKLLKTRPSKTEKSWILKMSFFLYLPPSPSAPGPKTARTAMLLHVTEEQTLSCLWVNFRLRFYWTRCRQLSGFSRLTGIPCLKFCEKRAWTYQSKLKLSVSHGGIVKRKVSSTWIIELQTNALCV